MENIKAFLLFLSPLLLFTFCAAQTQPLTRLQLQDYTNTTIYQNPNHGITGQILQNTFSNYNNSCVNLRTDTMFIMLFDSTYTYYSGMKVLIPDTSFSALVLNPVLHATQQTQNSYLAFPYQGIMRCDTAIYKGHFDTIHFKPLLGGNWSNFTQ